jgi:FemAB-related protein (PEP-CTERM system-associated)
MMSPFLQFNSAHPKHTCTLATANDNNAWNDFISSQPKANLGHLFEWKEVFERAYKKKCYYLSVVGQDRWEGVLPLVHMKSPLGGNRLVSLPFLDQAGLLTATPQAAETLWGVVKELINTSGAKGIDLRELAPEEAAAPERVTLVLPLPSSVETLWKSFSPKVRNQIRKAEKEGLRTELVERDRLVDFYVIFSHNMKDLGSPVHSLGFFEAIMEVFGPKARLFMTFDSNDRPVGGAIAIRFRQTVTVPWASSLREVFSLCPNHSLYWQILQYTIESEAELFDFGRSYKGSGTYQFKKQWGAGPQALLWTSFDAKGNSVPLKQFKPNEHSKVIWLWKHLPISAANWLGPLLRRQISN